MIGPYELDHIYTGDAFELASNVPDGSIDMIYCDPVYWNIGDYGWLAELATRVLKPGGAVIAQCGDLFFHDAWRCFRDAPGCELLHMPPLIEVIPFATAGYQIGPTTWIAGYHPHIFALRSERRVSLISRHYGTRDKKHHRWGDGTAFIWNYISRLTDDGGIILDPFSGSATVAVVAKLLGRRSLSFEIDPATATASRARLQQTQPPLLAVPAQQLPAAAAPIKGC
jgi:DNA modification methylase